MVVPAAQSEDAPLLPAFYAGRSVFITGGTGFLGKVLIERLLWTCPDVREVHVLLRHKRGHEPHARFAQLKQSQIFDNIRASCPWQLDKLHAVPGDVALPSFGLDDTALTSLHQVSVVFHSAANIKFWDSLESALHHNVASVEALMDLCDRLPQLEALVHVSTAYCHAERCTLEERVYPAPASLTGLRALLTALPEHLMSDITAKFISPKPNTYVYSKAIAESVIVERARGRYAAAIVRPSIVVSSHRHPYPGWIENLSGPSGVMVGCGKGLLRAFHVALDAKADLVPVDIVIDTTLAVAWEITTDKLPEVRVYNSCNSSENAMTWREFRTYLHRGVQDQPFDNVVYYPFTFACENKFLYKCMEVLLQTTPLYIGDYIAHACGLKLK